MMEEKNDGGRISEVAPSYSFGGVIRTMKEKGIIRALDDPEQGPHVHLTLLLGAIIFVSALIITITTFL